MLLILIMDIIFKKKIKNIMDTYKLLLGPEAIKKNIMNCFGKQDSMNNNKKNM